MANDAIRIRPVAAGDCAALLDIYRPHVVDSPVSFELTPPGEAEFARRIEDHARGWDWLVAEHEGRPIGYAYAGPYRPREAYRYAVETSVYLAADARRQGVGRRLYTALLPRLADRGFCSAYAGIALPNPASVRLHEQCGFERVGVFPRAGWKLGAWHDVLWMYRALRKLPP